MTEKIDKSFVGKYVCYAKPDGSFTWGRIKDQGFQNWSKGEKGSLHPDRSNHLSSG